MKKLFTLSLLCLLSLSIFANIQVTGVVVDEKGEPQIGVSIQVVGTTLGTITDVDGAFSISVPDDAKTLLFTAIGMKSQELPVKKVMHVVMSENVEVLQDVVITGYGNVTKGSFAGSAQAVDAETIEKKSPSEITKALAGEISGVQVVNTSGQPGTSAMIRIRGYGSINASSAPLYVVDGIPYDGDVSSIDPSDIASTTVLKDATATSLYGSRGANGVILITTKKGTSGEEGKIDVDVKYGCNTRLLPMYEVITSPEEYVEMSWLALVNASSRMTIDSRKQDASRMLFSENGKGLPAAYNIWDTDGASLIDNSGHFYPNVHRKTGFQKMDSWRDAIFRVGQKAEASVKISGGTEKTTYYTSFAYLKDEGYYIGSDFDRFTIRSNVNHQAKSWLKGGMNLSYAYSSMNNPGQGDNMNNGFAYVNGIPPIYPVYEYNEDGTIKYDPATKGNAYDYGMHEGYGRYFGAGINPAGSLIYDKQNSIAHQVIGSAFLEFKFYKDLKLTVNAGLQYYGQTSSDLTNPFYGDAAGIGRIAKDQYNLLTVTTNQLLEYDKTWGDHTFHAMVGHEIAFAKVTEMYGSKSHLGNPNSLELGNAVLMTGLSSAANQTAIQSVLANVTYNYNERYYLTANYRADGSSKFARGHRWGHFGSIGGAWRFTNEDFMPADVKEWIREGKLRLSWGALGNQEIGTNLFSDHYSIENVDGEVGYMWGYKGNKEITWESTSQWDLGLEFSINKYLDVELDYYHKLTTNLFFPKYIGPSIGYSYTYFNDGKMWNQGIEFELKAHAVDTRNVKLDIRLNGSHNANRVTELPKNIDTSTGAAKDAMYGGYAEGHSIFEYSLPEFAGVDPLTGKALYRTYYDSSIGNAGDYTSAAELLSKGQKGSNYITDLDQYKLNYPDQIPYIRDTVTTVGTAATSRFLGISALPAVSGGLGLDLEVYGVTLSVSCSYGIGGYGYDNAYAMLMSSGKVGSYNWHVDMRNAWNVLMTDEQKANATIPRLSNGSDLYTDYASTRFLTSNSYLSLNNIRLGYRFQKKLIEKIKLNSLELYLTADNLAVASARKGFNPMTSYTGASDAYQYTPLSTFMGGIKFQF